MAFIEYDDGTTIGMTEHDFGIVLPIELDLEGETIAGEDEFLIKIFKTINEEPIITKKYSNITDNTINFKLTKEESKLMEVGSYYYDIDWQQGESFLSNIVSKAKFKVLDKAGA